MFRSITLLCLAIVVLCILTSIEARERRHGDSIGSNKIQISGNYEDNEIDNEGRIRVGEPYKSLLQTTARFALAQSRISNHINMDTAMNLLNDAGYMLSKPAILFKVVKLAAVLVASLTATIFLFPGAHKFVDSAFKDPLNTLNLDNYFSNGVDQRSVLSILSTKTDDVLSRVGLRDTSCRERSLCYVGEILRCSFPQTAESITNFARDNFSNTGIKDHTFARAFISGFADRNCSAIVVQDSQSCLGKIINSILSNTPSQGSTTRR